MCKVPSSSERARWRVVPCCFRLSVCGANHNECVWCGRALIVGRNIKAKERQARKNACKHGAILFGWGDSLLRDMLDAGVFDCLNGEFGDIEVSLRYCVPSVWLTFVTNSVDQPLRGPISVSNLGQTEARKGRASAQASRREGRRPRGSGLLLGSSELPAARRLHPGCCQDLCSAAWVSDSPNLNELMFVL